MPPARTLGGFARPLFIVIPLLAAAVVPARGQEILALDDYLFFHAYYGAGLGRGSALRISTMMWENGWPRVGELR